MRVRRDVSMTSGSVITMMTVEMDGMKETVVSFRVYAYSIR